MNLPAAEEDDSKVKMIKMDIIFNNGQIMTSGYGSTNQQAEKNASIKGLLWLQDNKKEDIEKLLKTSLFS